MTGKSCPEGDVRGYGVKRNPIGMGWHESDPIGMGWHESDPIGMGWHVGPHSDGDGYADEVPRLHPIGNGVARCIF